jgi:hypothetical protein
MSKLFAKGSVENAALQITMAKQKTMQMEAQLREIITYTVGKKFTLRCSGLEQLSESKD